MQTSLIIIDDFLANPHEFREAALKLNYPNLDKPTYFPGRNSEKRVRLEGVDEVVGRIIGEKLTPTPGTGYGKPRIRRQTGDGASGLSSVLERRTCYSLTRSPCGPLAPYGR